MKKQQSPEFMNANYNEAEETAQPDNVTLQATSNKPIEQESIENIITEEQDDTTLNEVPLQDHAIAEASNNENQKINETDTDDLTPDARNFSALRELKKKAERERDEAIRQYRDMAAKINVPQQQQISEKDDLELNFNEDELIEGKHLKKIVNEVKSVKQQLNAYNQQARLNSTEVKLKQRFPDFDEVVSRENLEILIQREPELAAGLDANPDLYSKALTAYAMIRDLKIHIPPTDKKKINNIIRDNKRIDENLAKPQPAVAVAPQSSNSPLSQVSKYTDSVSNDEAAQIYRQMLERSKG